MGKTRSETYYYRGVRQGDRVRKICIGRGLLGRLAEAALVKSRTLREELRAAEREERARWTGVSSHADRFREWSELLTRAVLLASGFRRPDRHTWRRWLDGERILTRYAVTPFTRSARGARRSSAVG